MPRGFHQHEQWTERFNCDTLHLTVVNPLDGSETVYGWGPNARGKGQRKWYCQYASFLCTKATPRDVSIGQSTGHTFYTLEIFTQVSVIMRFIKLSI